MEIKKEYSVLYNTISHIIKQLEKSIKEANECIQLMKDAQKTSEEIYIQVEENEDND